MAAVFQDFFKTRTNQQPGIYNILRPHPNPYPQTNLNLGVLQMSGC